MPTDIDRWLREAVAAIKKGDKETGRDLLMRIIEQDEMHEQAWLWMSAAVDDREERIICLENVLTINPDNKAAQNGLKKLGVPLPRAQPEPAPPIPEPPPSSTASPLEPQATPEESTSSEAWREALKPSKPDGERSPVVERAEQRAQQRKRRQEKFAAVPQGQNRNIMDLFDAWLAALTFQERHLIAEMQAASFGRVAINIIFALFIASGLSAVSFFITANQPIPPEIQLQVDELRLTWQQELGQTFPLSDQMFGNTILLIGAFSGVIGIVINAVFFSITTHVGASMLGADGELIQTAHAVTMAMVAQQIVGLIPNLLTTVLQTATLPIVLVSGVLVLYNIAVAAVTLSAAHTDFGPIKAVFAYIIGAFVGLFFICACACMFVFGLGFLAGS